MDHLGQNLYKKLNILIPNLAQQLAEREQDDSAKSVLYVTGVKDLHCIYEGADGKDSHIITLYQYRESDGTFRPDPEYQIRVNPKLGIAEGLHYEQLSQRMNSPNDKLVIETLLDYWLSSINTIGHRIYLSKVSELNDVRRSKDNPRNRNTER